MIGPAFTSILHKYYQPLLALAAASADFLLASHLMEEPYARKVESFDKDTRRRLENFPD